MAEQTVSLEILVDALEAKKSVKELRDFIKETKSASLEAGAAGNTALANVYAQAAGKATDRMRDLNKQVNALQDTGSKLQTFASIGNSIAGGFAVAQGAMALFGTESENVQKALLKVQAAVAVLQGFQALTEGIKGMKNAWIILNTVMKSSPIFLMAGIITAVAGALVLFGSNTAQAAETQENFKNKIELANAALANQQKLINSRIALAKAEGASIQELRKLEIQAILEKEEARKNELELLKNRQIFIANENRTASDERKKEIKDELADNSKKIDSLITEEEILRNQLRIIDANYYSDLEKQIDDSNEKQREKNKKAYEQHYKDEEEAQEARKKLREQYIKDSADTERAAEQAEFDEKFGNEAEQLLLDTTREEEEAARKENLRRQEFDAEKQLEQDKLKIRTETYQNSIAIAEQTANALRSISDLVFEHQLAKAKGNAAKEKEIRRKQFNTNKAIGIVETVINTIKGVSQAIGAYPYPLNIVFASLSGIIGAAQTVALASKKFPEGDSAGGGGSVSVGGGGAAPALNPVTNTSTIINQNGIEKVKNDKIEPQRVYVLESDITKTQKNVARIEEKATIG